MARTDEECWITTWECPKEPISGALDYAIVTYYGGPYEWFPCNPELQLQREHGKESYPDGSEDLGTPQFDTNPDTGQVKAHVEPPENDKFELCCMALVEQSFKQIPGIDYLGFDVYGGTYNHETWCEPDNPGRGDIAIYQNAKAKGGGHVEFVSKDPTPWECDFQGFGSMDQDVNVDYLDRTIGMNGNLQFVTFLRPKVKKVEYICATVELLMYAIQQRGDPLVLDLDGNGIQTVGTSSCMHFDGDDNGFKEATGWVAPGDGMLMLDMNGNGRLDSGKELFGDFTILPNGVEAGTGFQALAYYDANGDGKIDTNDPIWSQLRVWQYNDVLLSSDLAEDDPNSATATGQRYFASQDSSGCG